MDQFWVYFLQIVALNVLLNVGRTFHAYGTGINNAVNFEPIIYGCHYFETGHSIFTCT